MSARDKGEIVTGGGKVKATTRGKSNNRKSKRTEGKSCCDVGSPIAGHDLPHGSKREEHDHSPSLTEAERRFGVPVLAALCS